MVTRKEKKHEIKVGHDFYKFLLKKKNKTEPAMEDTLRRLVRYKKRR